MKKIYTAIILTLLCSCNGDRVVSRKINYAMSCHNKGYNEKFGGRVACLEKYAKEGDPASQYWLGVEYQIFLDDKNKAIEWYKKAAEQGEPRALEKLDSFGWENEWKEDLKKRAEEGEVTAQKVLALSYMIGLDFEKDTVRAAELLKKAANQGDAEAQEMLADAYFYGSGITQDRAQAFNWYEKAASQGNAQRKLADAYRYGYGTPKNEAKAIELYKKAASQGDKKAQEELNFNKSDNKSMDWYKQAAENGDAEAQKKLADAYHYGHGFPKDEVKALEWYQKAAEQGDTKALGYLARSSIFMYGISKDSAKGIDLFKKLAEEGNPRAQKYLADFFDDGKIVPKDRVKALELYEKAANQGDIDAQNRLAFLYELNSDNSKAIEWYEKAANQGDTDSQFKLSKLYYSTDKAKSVEWLVKVLMAQETVSSEFNKILAQVELAKLKWEEKKFLEIKDKAEQGDIEAQRKLGSAYKLALGVPKDMNKAVEWYKQAAEQGDKKGRNMMIDTLGTIRYEKKEANR